MAILFVGSLFIVAPAGIVLLVAYSSTGLVLAARRPRQPIAWLLVLIGVGLALGNVIVSGSMPAIVAGTTTSFESFTVWANGTGWGFAFVCLEALAFVFPSGSLPNNRTRPVAITWLAMSIACVMLIAFAPVVSITPSGSAFGIDVPNPYAIMPEFAAWSVIPDPGSLFTFLFVLVATSLLALFVRFRRSSGLERLQYRWLVWSIGVVTLGTVLWATATVALRVDEARLFVIPLVIAYPCVPIAVVIAVLRYRLYEIDRLVSRTLGWGLATTTVAGPVRRRRARAAGGPLRPHPGPGSRGGGLDAARLCRVPAGSSARPGSRRPAVRPASARGGAEPRGVSGSGSSTRWTSARSPGTWRRPPSRRSGRRPAGLWIRPLRSARP